MKFSRLKDNSQVHPTLTINWSGIVVYPNMSWDIFHHKSAREESWVEKEWERESLMQFQCIFLSLQEKERSKWWKASFLHQNDWYYQQKILPSHYSSNGVFKSTCGSCWSRGITLQWRLNTLHCTFALSLLAWKWGFLSILRASRTIDLSKIVTSNIS